MWNMSSEVEETKQHRQIWPKKCFFDFSDQFRPCVGRVLVKGQIGNPQYTRISLKFPEKIIK